MICANCPLLLFAQDDRYYCERHECEVNPGDDCIEDEEGGKA